MVFSFESLVRIAREYLVEALHLVVYFCKIIPSTSIQKAFSFTKLFNKNKSYTHLRTFGCLYHPHTFLFHKLAPSNHPMYISWLSNQPPQISMCWSQYQEKYHFQPRHNRRVIASPCYFHGYSCSLIWIFRHLLWSGRGISKISWVAPFPHFYPILRPRLHRHYHHLFLHLLLLHHCPHNLSLVMTTLL